MKHYTQPGHSFQFFIFIFFFICLTTNVLGQSQDLLWHRVDSLTSFGKFGAANQLIVDKKLTFKSSELRKKLLYTYVQVYAGSDSYDSLIVLVEKMRTAVAANSYELGLLENILGDIAYNQGDFVVGLPHLEKAIGIFAQRKKNDDFPKPWLFKIAGNTSYLLHISEKAVAYFNQSLTLFKKYGPDSDLEIANILNNWGMLLLEDENDIQTAKIHLKEALRRYKLYSDDTDVGDTYVNLGKLHRIAKNYEESKMYYEKALAIWSSNLEEYGSRNVRSHMNLGVLNEQAQNFDLALEYYLKAKDFADGLKEDHLGDFTILNSNISNIYFEKKDFSKARYYALLANKQLALKRDKNNNLFFNGTVEEAFSILSNVGRVLKAEANQPSELKAAYLHYKDAMQLFEQLQLMYESDAAIFSKNHTRWLVEEAIEISMILFKKTGEEMYANDVLRWMTISTAYDINKTTNDYLRGQMYISLQTLPLISVKLYHFWLVRFRRKLYHSFRSNLTTL